MAREERPAQQPDVDPAEMEEAIRNEAQQSWAAPSVGVVTPAQVKGGLTGALAGALIGGIVGVLIALLPIVALVLWLRIVVIGSICVVAGSTVGGLLGGFFRPDIEGETGDLPGEGPRSVGETRSGHAE